MENYVIEEIIDIDFDGGYVTIKFKLERDCVDEYRVLQTKEYYDWCFNDYQMENVYDYGGSDKDDDSEGFTIFNWEENYKDNEYILDFIYESYDKFSELPEIFIE
jgi:hypothetical protein